MTRVSASQLRALLCAMLLIVCTLAALPFAETGLDDDFSYIYSARSLAQTGQVHYAGWASAMVGWQLAMGAAFIRLFGFSFSVTRVPILLIASATAFLLHRLLVRCGLSSSNAVLATLTVMLSPVALPLAFSFMTDMAGLFCTVLCLYCCVRSLQATDIRRSSAWLVSAMLFTAAGGTARQTVWLCLLSTVPCTVWLLRKRRPPFAVLTLVWLASGAFAYGSMTWFYRQPYSVRELPVAGYIDRDLVVQVIANVARAVLQCCLMLLPALIAFAALFPRRNRRAVAAAAASATVAVALLAFAAYRGQLPLWLPPFHEPGNFFSSLGVVDLREIGTRPAAIPVWLQLAVTLVTLASVSGLLGFLLVRRGTAVNSAVSALLQPQPEHTTLTWRQFLWLTVPFTLVYLVLVTHRTLFAFPYDRYFLPVLPIATVVLVRLYQERVAPQLPRICFAVLAVFAVASTAMLHDTYADRRAELAAAQRLQAAGVPRTAFYGGFEYDGWTQIQQMGWMNVIAMRWPDGVHMERPIPRHMTVKPCGQIFAHLVPAIQPRYGISFDRQACDGPSEFGPVTYHTWLPPFTHELYIRKVTTPAY